jgi:hypothetical protein
MPGTGVNYMGGSFERALIVGGVRTKHVAEENKLANDRLKELKGKISVRSS